MKLSFNSIGSAAVAVLVVLAVLSGAVAAQPDAGDVANETEEQLEDEAAAALEDDGGSNGRPEEIEGQVDSEVVLVDYEFVDGTMHLTFFHGGDRPKTVTVAERGDSSEGATEVAVTERRLIPGETTVSMPLVHGDTVGISTADGIDEQRMIEVSASPSANWFNGPATWGIVALSVIVALAGSFWGTKYYLEKQERQRKERSMEVVR